MVYQINLRFWQLTKFRVDQQCSLSEALKNPKSALYANNAMYI